MSWIYEGKVISCIDDLPKGTVGFVYEIMYIPTGRRYVGKKTLYFHRTLPPLKGMKRKRRVTKESDWKTYYGSHHKIQEILKENTSDPDLLFKRDIIEICFNKKQMTYYELKWQMVKNVLVDDNYFNENLLGKFYRKDLLA